MCEKVDPKWKCLDCRMPLCDCCKSMHVKLPLLKGHKIEALTAEEPRKGIDEITFCPQHPDKILEMSCNSCNILVCFLCALKDHPLHDTETIHDALETTCFFLTESNVNMDKNMQIIKAQIDGVTKRVEETRETFATKRIELDESLEKVSRCDK